MEQQITKPYRRTVGIARFLVRNYLVNLLEETRFPSDLEILNDAEFERIYKILALLIRRRREGKHLQGNELALVLGINRSHIWSLMNAVKEGLLAEKIILLCHRGKQGGYWLTNIPNNRS